MINCKICERNCKSYRSLSSHIKKYHKLETKEYYITYLKKDTEGICNADGCNENLRFISIEKGYNGYDGYINKYCSIKCSSNTKEVREKFNNTIIEKYGDKNYRNIEKNKTTNLKKYGVENPSSSPIIKEIRKKNLMEKYGVENIFQKTDIKNNIRNKFRDIGRWLKDDDAKLSYKNYYKLVWNETKKIKHIVYDNWNGFDYYDNEYISENLKLYSNHKNYPTIDHKISVRYGFDNNIDFKIIADIDNLCITKRYINNSKGYLIESEYKKKRC